MNTFAKQDVFLFVFLDYGRGHTLRVRGLSFQKVTTSMGQISRETGYRRFPRQPSSQELMSHFF
jgi:hypothetical protein